MSEMWKPINDYPKYEISNFGNVKSNYKNKLLKEQKDKDGYFQVNLFENKVSKTIKIHKLVALHFINNPEDKPQINHIDGNKQNNNYLNLEWCTTQENTFHAINNNLADAKGEKHGGSKLIPENIIDIRNSDLSPKELAIKYNICIQTISDIRLRKRWKHI